MDKFCRFIFCIFVLTIFSGCQTLPSLTDQSYFGQKIELKELCRQHNVQWRWDSVSQVITINQKTHQVRGMIGSNIILIDNKVVVLSSPVEIKRSIVFVPYDFQSKVFDSPEYDFSLAKFRKIIIDAGHGGKDPGARGRVGTEEKKVVLDVARRLENILEKDGFDVTMTRDKDKFISLEERTEIAARRGADLFLSIHANASKERGVRGIEIFYLRDLPAGQQTNPQRRKNFKTKSHDFAMERGSPVLDEILMDMLYAYKQNESRQLAIHTSKILPKYIKVKNRGSKAAGFYVLKNTLVPSILVEIGFLTNQKEEKLLNQSAYRERIAKGLAQSVRDYIYAKSSQ